MSLFQIDNYGPWTVTPEPRRETDLQSLQAGLYADLAEFVGQYDGYVFYDRFDNMLGVTNGMGVEEHAQFQRAVDDEYPITVSVGVGTAATPVEALGQATEALQKAGSAQDPDRTEILEQRGDDVGGPLTIAHFDIVDVTGSYTDRENAADTTLTVQRATVELASYLRTQYDSIAHFVGGDNIIAVCPELSTAAFEDTREHVRERAGVDLQVGVGRGQTAHAAGHRAKIGLEECRESGTRIRQIPIRATSD